MHKYVIADTSVLIIFDKLEQLNILGQVYHRIYITPEVAEEYNKTLPAWISIEYVFDKKYQSLLKTQIDVGEASVIALAMERENSMLLLDDLKARKLAKNLNLKFSGTLGVINKAKSLGFISKIKPLLAKIQETDFRISDDVISHLLRRNEE